MTARSALASSAVDPALIAAVVVEALGPEIESRCATAIVVKSTDHTIPALSDVTSVPSATISLLDANASPLSRITASVAQALDDAGSTPPVTSMQIVSGVFSGAATELKILYAFEGFNYRIYGYRFTVKDAASDISFGAGEENSSVAISSVHRLAVGSALAVGPTEFIGVLDAVADTPVVLRKTTGATVIYDVVFDYL